MSLLIKDISMRQNLGNFLTTNKIICSIKSNLLMLLFIPFFGLILHAEDFSYSVTTSHHTPYIKEPIFLTLEINQTNPQKVLFFNFDLVKSPSYSFQRVEAKEEGKHHYAHVKYSYLIYPLKAGRVEVALKLQKRVTTDDSIAYSYSGDRDNVRDLVTTDSDISLPNMLLEVKNLPVKAQLVGDFKLDYQINSHQAQVYQAIPFEITITGKGYPPLLKNIIPKEHNFTLFKEKPTIKSHASLRGTKNTINYSMALSHKENFQLKEIKIDAFNPKTKKSYTLIVPKQDFKIEPIEVATLIDKEDSPKPLRSDFEWVGNFFSYLIVFIAGYLTANLLKWQKRSDSTEATPLSKKIQHSKDEKELLTLLIATDSQRFKIEIEALEQLIYNNGKSSFKTIQKKLLEEQK